MRLKKKVFEITVEDELLEHIEKMAKKLRIPVQQYFLQIIELDYDDFENKVDHRYMSEVSFKELIERGLYA